MYSARCLGFQSKRATKSRISAGWTADGVDDESVFAVDGERLASLEATLDELGHDLVENVEMGFPVGALLDILPISDALIYQKLAELIEAGIVRKGE